MGYKTIAEAVAEAYESKQLCEYLTGKNGYAFPSFFQQIGVCTDWTRIIPAIYTFYEKETGVKEEYEKAILQVLNGTAEDLWCGANTIYFQRGKEKEGKSPFKVHKKVLTELRKQLIAKKEELQSFFPYGKNGYNAYEDILRMNYNFIHWWNEKMWDTTE